MPLTWIAIGSLAVPLIAAVLFVSGITSSDAAQFCFAEAVATPPGSAEGALASADRETTPGPAPNSVCFDSQEQADAYGKEVGLEYCVDRTDSKAAASSQGGTPDSSALQCFDTQDEARDYLEEGGTE